MPASQQRRDPDTFLDEQFYSKHNMSNNWAVPGYHSFWQCKTTRQRYVKRKYDEKQIIVEKSTIKT